MGFTNAWSITRPTGTLPANQIDDEIRAFRLDVQERMNVIFEDFSADPLVAKPAFGGKVTGNTVVIHHAAFINDDGLVAPRTAKYLQEQNAPTTWYARVTIPVGVTITKFEALVDPIGGNTINTSLQLMTFDDVAGTNTIINVGANGNGAVVVSSAVNYVTLNNEVYFVQFTITTNGQRFYAARITYDSPDVSKRL